MINQCQVLFENLKAALSQMRERPWLLKPLKMWDVGTGSYWCYSIVQSRQDLGMSEHESVLSCVSVAEVRMLT